RPRPESAQGELAAQQAVAGAALLAGERLRVRQRLVQPLLELRRRLLDVLDRRLQRQVPDRYEHAVRAERPHVPGAGTQPPRARGPVPGRPSAGTGLPGSTSNARRIASATSRLTSPELAWVCSPASTDPSGRVSAGQAIGRTVASVTVRSAYSPVSASRAVAAGTSSRIAIQSHSPGRPSNGRWTSA